MGMQCFRILQTNTIFEELFTITVLIKVRISYPNINHFQTFFPKSLRSIERRSPLVGVDGHEVDATADDWETAFSDSAWKQVYDKTTNQTNVSWC